MIFVDTHAHLYSSEFDLDRSQVVSRATQAGVTQLLLPDVDSTSREAMLTMADQYECCTPMIGLHPTSINENPAWREELREVERVLTESPHHRFCAVGEIGIDLYWSREYEEQQREAFRFQIELALRENLPVAIHCRDAWDALLEELTQYKGQSLRGVIHAFTGTVDHYREILAIGDFVFGIGGVVTFKKSSLAPVVAQMELSRIVLETDAPYLTPAPHRGKRNESSYIPLIGAAIADLHATTLEEVAEVTTTNAQRIFGLKTAK